MKKPLFSLFILLSCLTAAHAQTAFGEKPRLVVGIVVDQMRWDYLSRYYDQFTEGGFRRLIDGGYSCNNCLINYVPTITAIGHTSVYTGTTPAFHGICGNNFYIDGRKTYCCYDDSVSTVGAEGDKGKMSPRNLLATTIGDQLRLHTDFKSRVVGVSYKDRAAILPAGHAANAAYWLDTKHGCFVSSTYYMKQLPRYARDYNAQMARNKAVTEAGANIGMSPLCGTVITDMAIATIKGEQLGHGEATDMLCVSYSQTDVIGHQYGTRGAHTDEAYLSLDRDLARLFATLDAEVGQGQWLAFLTADHGGAHNWHFMQDNRLAAGPIYIEDLRRGAEQAVAQTLGATKPVVADVMEYRFYLDRASIAAQGLDADKVKAVIADTLAHSPHIVTAVDMAHACASTLPQQIAHRITMGWHPRRGGDVIAIPEPGYYSWWNNSVPTGTTHCAWNPYDAHIPCLFYGWKIAHGATSRETHITDIAPTICQLLHIQQPNACTGEPITEITH